MSKLFKLKEWLTLDEAAAHISSVLGEPATVADLYRFALDGHLTLSIDFVNHAMVKKGKRQKTEQIEFRYLENDPFTGEKLDVPFALPKNNTARVSEDDWIALENSVESISGLWDLPMVGAEQLDIEHEYQQLTSGLEVTLGCLEGAFVERGDDICQLQSDYENNEFQSGSKAQQKDLNESIARKGMPEDEAQKLRDEFAVKRKKYLEERKKSPPENNYYPSGGLAEHDHVLVVRTKEVTRFIQSLEDEPTSEKPLTTNERNSLLVLIGALCEELNINPSERGVAASLTLMTETLGAPLTDDTIRKILKQIEDAVSIRSK